MLEKTFALLNGIPAGTYVPEEKKCYDDSEIEQLSQILKRLVWAPSQIRKKLQQAGITIIPCNYYSEIPSIEEIERSFNAPDQSFDLIFDDQRMREILAELHQFSHEFDPPREASNAGSYAWEGNPFSFSDAMAYYCMIRRHRPATIVEVGSGWSTLVADMACKANGFGQIICIEPFPPEFLRGIGSVKTLIERPVQDISPGFFNDTLRDGDILFIDSTHTVKHGSDCLHLYLSVLPRLSRWVFIHAHDIHLPAPLPLNELRDRHVYWTEQYLLMAYLIDNPRTTVQYGSAYHFLRNRELLRAFMHGRFHAGGGSLWFSQKGAPGA
jgi:Methyltransferase domain